MKIGKLRHTVKVQYPKRVTDAGGGAVIQWQTLAILHANVRPATAREQNESSQLEQITTHKVTIRYSSEFSRFDNKHRLLFDDRSFRINTVTNKDERNRWIELDCEEYHADEV